LTAALTEAHGNQRGDTPAGRARCALRLRRAPHATIVEATADRA
jgi:hypothetical protein